MAYISPNAKRAAANEFDVFITGDRNLSFQQNLSDRGIAVVVLYAPGTQLHQMLPLIPYEQEE